MSDIRNPELEAVIRAAPNDLDAYEVYADWLIERGEPHGEVISFAVRRAREGPTKDFAVLTAEAHLLRNREAIFGELGRMPRHLVECDLALGFLDAVRIYSMGDAAGLALCHVFTHRIGAFVRDVAMQAKMAQAGPNANEDRTTAQFIWDVLLDLGVPRTVESIAVPLLLDDNTRGRVDVLAHVPRCTFPLRVIPMLAPHRGALVALRTLTLTASGRPTALMMDALLDHASAFADVERIVLSLTPPFRYELTPLREALPQLELGWVT